jgi:phosphoribosyl-ATP pyrophosphohydrolase/phosphoribosyl-AMP cyclohydrolase
MIEPTYDERGLAPAIIQDAVTNRVLMLGYVNAESLAATVDTGFMHFWSRSRNALWKKGETSGNTLRVVDVSLDCDSDALLVLVDPAGPVCHLGTTSCFDPHDGSPERSAPSGTFDALWNTIVGRREERPEGSYTTSLLDGGVDAVGRKVTEEATEVLMAAKDHAAGSGPPDRIIEETADLMYHLLVLLAERGVDLADVETELRRRAG